MSFEPPFDREIGPNLVARANGRGRLVLEIPGRPAGYEWMPQREVELWPSDEALLRELLEARKP